MRRENHEKWDGEASRKQKGDEATSCADHRLNELTWKRETRNVVRKNSIMILGFDLRVKSRGNFSAATFKISVANSSDYSNEFCNCNNLSRTR